MIIGSLLQFATTNTTYTSTMAQDTAASSAALGLTLILLFAIYLPLLIYAAVGVVGMWKTFAKTGRPGWYAIVPIYNSMVLAEIAGKPNWWGFGMLISPLNFVLSILFGIDIAKRFGRTDMFGVIALGLFSPIGYCMIGFGKDVYNENATPTTR